MYHKKSAASDSTDDGREDVHRFCPDSCNNPKEKVKVAASKLQCGDPFAAILLLASTSAIEFCYCLT